MKAFKNLTIVQKLLVPLILMGLLTLGTGFYALSQMHTVGNEYQGLLRRESEAIQSILRANETASHIGRISYTMVAEPDSYIIESMKEEIDFKVNELNGHLAEVERLLPGLKNDLDLARTDIGVMLDRIEEARQALLQGKTEAGARILVDQFDGRLIDVLDRLSQLSKEIDTGLAKGEAAAEARYGQALWITTAVGVTGTALVMALALWLTIVSVSRPLKRIVATMTRLADGDLSVTISGADAKDEIGATARAVTVFQRSMQETERLRAAQEDMKTQAEADKRAAMAQLANEFQASMEQVVRQLAGSAQHMRGTAESLTSVADQTDRQTGDVASAADMAATSVHGVAAAVEELSASIRDIASHVAESARIANDAVDETARSNETVASLVDAAQKIGNVVRMISEIAAQTNLLALNATIEAARAGEAGKGFAVVAGEVKNLASQTAKATEEISTQISAMQSVAGTAATAIQSVGGTIGRISGIVTTIAAAVEQQDAATREIAQGAAQAAGATTNVSTIIADVSRAAAETGTMAGDVLTAAGELTQECELLRHHVEGFVTKIRMG